MKQQVIDIKNDGIYTILELEDHTLVPLISIENFINNLLNTNINVNNSKECIYCHRNTVKLVSLNNLHYICSDCATKLIENFMQLGESINLNLNKFNPQLAKKLIDFVKGNIKVNTANFQIVKKSDDNIINNAENNTDKKFTVKNNINFSAGKITKDANVIYSDMVIDSIK